MPSMDRRRPRCTSGQFTRRPTPYIGRDAALQTGSSRHSEVGTHRFQDYFTLTVVLLLCEAVAHCWMYLWGPFMFIGGAVAGLNLTNNRVGSEVQHGNRRASTQKLNSVNACDKHPTCRRLRRQEALLVGALEFD